MIVTERGILNVGQGLELRPAPLCDRDEFVSLYQQNLAELIAVKEDSLDTNEAELGARFDEAAADVRDGIALHYGIHLDDKLIGWRGLRFAGRYQAEGAGWLDKDQQGKGYATRSAQAAISYTFAAHNVTSVLFQIRARNTPSIRLVTRLGAVKMHGYTTLDDGDAIQLWRKRHV